MIKVPFLKNGKKKFAGSGGVFAVRAVNSLGQYGPLSATVVCATQPVSPVFSCEPWSQVSATRFSIRVFWAHPAPVGILSSVTVLRCANVPQFCDSFFSTLVLAPNTEVIVSNLILSNYTFRGYATSPYGSSSWSPLDQAPVCVAAPCNPTLNVSTTWTVPFDSQGFAVLLKQHGRGCPISLSSTGIVSSATSSNSTGSSVIVVAFPKNMGEKGRVLRKPQLNRI
jgi:hypothetical protein